MNILGTTVTDFEVLNLNFVNNNNGDIIPRRFNKFLRDDKRIKEIKDDTLLEVINDDTP